MDVDPDGLAFIAIGALMWLLAPWTSGSSYYKWLGYPYEYALKLNRRVSYAAIAIGVVLFSGLIGK